MAENRRRNDDGLTKNTGYAFRVRGTISAGIQSGRALSAATEVTISSPRSIEIICRRALTGLEYVEIQVALIEPQIDRNAVIQFQRECRTAPRDSNVFRRRWRFQLLRLLHELRVRTVRRSCATPDGDISLPDGCNH